jgi:AraC-like DNA-binding protein
MISDQGARVLDRERTLHRLFSTDDVTERERFSYWRDMVNHVFVDLRPERSTEGPFSASITTGSLGAVGAVFVRSGAQRVYRSTPEIARSPEPRYFVNYQLEGECTLRQRGGEEVHVATGDLALVDTTNALELGFQEGFCHFTIELPAPLVRARFGDPDRLGGRVVRASDGIGALVSGYMRAAAAMTTSADPVVHAIGGNLVDLVTIAFGAASEAVENAAPCLDDARLRAVCAYVEEHLADPDLGPTRIAADLKMSTRYLHKLFERRNETLMQRILRRRLERCRNDLAHPSLRARTISEIAFAWGFSDLSHFGRAFKAAYGETPRDWRRRA